MSGQSQDRHAVVSAHDAVWRKRAWRLAIGLLAVAIAGTAMASWHSQDLSNLEAAFANAFINLLATACGTIAGYLMSDRGPDRALVIASETGRDSARDLQTQLAMLLATVKEIRSTVDNRVTTSASLRADIHAFMEILENQIEGVADLASTNVVNWRALIADTDYDGEGMRFRDYWLSSGSARREVYADIQLNDRHRYRPGRQILTLGPAVVIEDEVRNHSHKPTASQTMDIDVT